MSRAFREPPARKIGRSRRALTGEVQVKGQPIGYESSLEMDLLMILDFLQAVSAVRGQPVTIRYQDREGQARRYTPDVEVTLGRPFSETTLYEVKYREDLFANCSQLKPGFHAARAYARERGQRFKILTEVEIRGPFLGNVRFLRGYRHREPHDGIEGALIATLMAYEEASAEQVLLATFEDHDRARHIAQLWRLLAVGRICGDLTHPLTMKTPLWVSDHEASTWTDPHDYRLRPLIGSARERRFIESNVSSIYRACSPRR